MSAQRPNLPVMIGGDVPLPAFGPAEEEISSPGMSLVQILTILRAYWRRSLIVLLSLVFFFGLIIKILPKSYVATATLIVSRGDQDPLASNDIPGNLQSAFIPTQIELIMSPVVLQPVIHQLHLMDDLEFTRGFRGPPAALREVVLNNLSQSLSVFQGAGSDLLYIAATSKNPVEAAAIANAVASEYLKLNRQRIDEPALQRAQLYSQELADLREKTIQAQQQVTTFRQQHGMIDLAPSSRDDADVTLKDLENKLLMAQNEERTLQAQMQSGAPTSPNLSAYTVVEPGSGAGNEAGVGTEVDMGGGTGGISASAENRLNGEEAQLAKLRATLGPRHPAVLELESEIASTKRSIDSGLSAQLADARRLVQRYQSAIASERQTVLLRRKIQDQGTKLLLELQSAQTTYRRALDGYPQIKFASNGAFSDVSLVSRAVPPVVAVKPHKVKYFLASCVLSFGLALGLPFLYELLINRRLRCRDDLERHFGIAVLAQFDPIADRAAR